MLHMVMAVEKMSEAEALDALSVLNTHVPGDGHELGAGFALPAAEDRSW